MNKEQLKRIIIETVKETIQEKNAEEVQIEENHEQNLEEQAPGMSAADFRTAMIQLAKDSQGIQKVSAAEREIVLMLITQIMDLAREGNIATGTIGTLLNKVMGVQSKAQKAQKAEDPSLEDSAYPGR